MKLKSKKLKLYKTDLRAAIAWLDVEWLNDGTNKYRSQKIRKVADFYEEI